MGDNSPFLLPARCCLQPLQLRREVEAAFKLSIIVHRGDRKGKTRRREAHSENALGAVPCERTALLGNYQLR